VDEQVNRDNNGEADGMNLEDDSKLTFSPVLKLNKAVFSEVD